MKIFPWNLNVTPKDFCFSLALEKLSWVIKITLAVLHVNFLAVFSTTEVLLNTFYQGLDLLAESGIPKECRYLVITGHLRTFVVEIALNGYQIIIALLCTHLCSRKMQMYDHPEEHNYREAAMEQLQHSEFELRSQLQEVFDSSNVAFYHQG